MRAVLARIVLALAILAILAIPAVAHAQTWPNQPAGSTVLTDVNWSTNTPDGPSNPPGSGWCSTGCGAGLGSITTSTLAPVSPPNVLHHQFNTSNGFGTGGNHFDFHTVGGYRTIYVGAYLRTSNPFEGYPSTINKILFLWMVNRGQQIFTFIKANQPFGPFSDVGAALELHNPPPDIGNCHLSNDGDCPVGTVNVHANRGGFTVPLGQFWRYEVCVRGSETPTSRDGSIRWWANGVLVGEYTQLNTPRQNWGEVGLDQAWDGTTLRSTPDFWEYDHVRIAQGGICGSGGGADTTPPSQVTGLTATPLP